MRLQSDWTWKVNFHSHQEDSAVKVTIHSRFSPDKFLSYETVNSNIRRLIGRQPPEQRGVQVAVNSNQSNQWTCVEIRHDCEL